MARPDGRIEKGQRLGSAISARAWNRAQEAADRVLGAGTGVEAGAGTTGPSKIVFPVQIAGGTPFMYSVVRVLVEPLTLRQAATAAPYSDPPHASDKAMPDYLKGSVYTGNNPGAWCICEEKLASSGAAFCVFSGITFARVRVRSSSHGFVEPSVQRDAYGATPAYPQISGVLDSTECECAGAAKILAIGGAVIGNVYWAMILL
jgi:hypothetical protein